MAIKYETRIDDVHKVAKELGLKSSDHPEGITVCDLVIATLNEIGRRLESGVTVNQNLFNWYKRRKKIKDIFGHATHTESGPSLLDGVTVHLDAWLDDWKDLTG